MMTIHCHHCFETTPMELEEDGKLNLVMAAKALLNKMM